MRSTLPLHTKIPSASQLEEKEKILSAVKMDWSTGVSLWRKPAVSSGELLWLTNAERWYHQSSEKVIMTRIQRRVNVAEIPPFPLWSKSPERNTLSIDLKNGGCVAYLWCIQTKGCMHLYHCNNALSDHQFVSEIVAQTNHTEMPPRASHCTSNRWHREFARQLATWMLTWRF